MGVRIDVQYDGDLQCTAIHGPSGDRLVTDAPVDNQGRGLHFSPTDLLATSLGACILTTMGIAAKTRSLDLKGSRVAVEKIMEAVPVRHVGLLKVQVTLPATLDERARKVMENAARTCPVHASLGPDTRIEVEFRYGL